MFIANRTHYEKITAMCYLLNGRRNREEEYKHYGSSFFDTGYRPNTIEIHTIDGKVHQVEFNSIDLVYKALHVRFDGKTIHLRIVVNGKDWGNDFEFWDDYAKKTAESIFGEGISPVNVVIYTEIALKDLCRNFCNEIQETIASIRCWATIA